MNENLFGPSEPELSPHTLKGIQIGNGKSAYHWLTRSVDPEKITSLVDVPRNVVTVHLANEQKLFLVEDASSQPFSINGEVFHGYGYVLGSEGKDIVDTTMKLSEVTFVGR